MIFERARTETSDEVDMYIAEAKRDYENALNRFNNAKSESMIKLAIFDMNTAMKKCCFIIENAKNG